MASLNQMNALGNLVRNPDLRFTPSGTAICEFTIAISRKSKNNDEVLYLVVVAWGKIGENCKQYLAKGSAALVNGYLKEEKYTTRDGANRSTIKLVAENVQFISNNNQAQATNEESNQTYETNKNQSQNRSFYGSSSYSSHAEQPPRHAFEDGPKADNDSPVDTEIPF